MLQQYPKKLEDKLDDFHKGYLDAVDDIIDNELDAIKDNYTDEIDHGVVIFDTIDFDIAKAVFKYIKAHLKGLRESLQVAFIDSNHYSIDKDGNVIDDNEEKK